jgi:hypothetical protein
MRLFRPALDFSQLSTGDFNQGFQYTFTGLAAQSVPQFPENFGMPFEVPSIQDEGMVCEPIKTETETSGSFPCTQPDCPQTFKRKHDFVRHLQTHDPGQAVWLCGRCYDDPFTNSDYSSIRKDHVYTHLKGPHKVCQDNRDWQVCDVDGCTIEGVKGLIFDSAEALRDHNAKKHGKRLKLDNSTSSRTIPRKKGTKSQKGPMLTRSNMSRLQNATFQYANSETESMDSNTSASVTTSFQSHENSIDTDRECDQTQEDEITEVKPAEFLSLSNDPGEFTLSPISPSTMTMAELTIV